jgi:hypothetical protein
MSEPTRRGFLGALAALVAAPRVLFGRTPPKPVAPLPSARPLVHRTTGVYEVRSAEKFAAGTPVVMNADGTISPVTSKAQPVVGIATGYRTAPNRAVVVLAPPMTNTTRR